MLVMFVVSTRRPTLRHSSTGSRDSTPALALQTPPNEAQIQSQWQSLRSTLCQTAASVGLWSPDFNTRCP